MPKRPRPRSREFIKDRVTRLEWGEMQELIEAGAEIEAARSQREPR